MEKSRRIFDRYSVKIVKLENVSYSIYIRRKHLEVFKYSCEPLHNNK